jgi:hypothetical protein
MRRTFQNSADFVCAGHFSKISWPEFSLGTKTKERESKIPGVPELGNEAVYVKSLMQQMP